MVINKEQEVMAITTQDRSRLSRTEKEEIAKREQKGASTVMPLGRALSAG